MFGVRMKRLLGSGVFWGTVFLFAGIMVAGAYGDLQGARVNSHPVLYLYLVTSDAGMTAVLIPVLTMIPFAFFYVEELEKKAVYYNLIRCSKGAYYGSNIAAAILSSALVSAFALMIFILVCLLYGADFEGGFASSQAVMSAFVGSIYEAWLKEGGMIWVLLVKLLALVASSMPWGVLCLLVSVYTKNKYVILAAPFLITRLVSAVVPEPLYLLSPSMPTLPTGHVTRLPDGGILYMLVYNGVFIAVLSVLYYVMSKRRYHREGI